MNQKEFKELVSNLAKEWTESGAYDTYASILEFLDTKFDRKFYLSLNPNFLIHEQMREDLEGTTETLDREIIISGFMECYDFCQQTKDMTEEEIASFENFKD